MSIMEDKELTAISTMLKAIEGLNDEEVKRVLDYIHKRLGINNPVIQQETLIDTNINIPNSKDFKSTSSILDIRTLKEQKSPKTALQMAAIVAYYLSELAPLDEKRESINVQDIAKYFKQANFPLPKGMKDILVNAKDAGYLDSTGEFGQYKLNPVGYNLVVHNLPHQGKRQAKRKKK